jgi:hypothetical protein
VGYERVNGKNKYYIADQFGEKEGDLNWLSPYKFSIAAQWYDVSNLRAMGDFPSAEMGEGEA